MKWHKYNISRLISQFLPIEMRRLETVLLMMTITTPQRWLMDNIRYKMQHDCRVMYMEKVLNESFEMPGYDPSQHEESKIIIIGPGNIPEEVYIYLATEPNEPVWLGADPVYLYTQAEQNENYYDFSVIVPASYQNRENEIVSLVDYYKLAGKKYKIIYI